MTSMAIALRVSLRIVRAFLLSLLRRDRPGYTYNEKHERHRRSSTLQQCTAEKRRRKRNTGVTIKLDAITRMKVPTMSASNSHPKVSNTCAVPKLLFRNLQFRKQFPNFIEHHLFAAVFV